MTQGQPAKGTTAKWADIPVFPIGLQVVTEPEALTGTVANEAVKQTSAKIPSFLETRELA